MVAAESADPDAHPHHQPHRQDLGHSEVALRCAAADDGYKVQSLCTDSEAARIWAVAVLPATL